jgi:hypothetical protein
VSVDLIAKISEGSANQLDLQRAFPLMNLSRQDGS